VNDLSSHTSKIQSTFEQFHKLILEIENQEFSSELLSEKRNLVVNADTKASSILKKFAKHLDALDQRSNMLIGVILNAFMLRDLRQSYNIEKWIEAHKTSVPVWFETITFFDAYNSFGNFRFNHPKYIFPKINDNIPVLKVKGAGHPLLKESTMILNDIEINSEEFFIITGANMAGKSTFLRTVSLQIVMGNLGLPVCAETAEYNPIKLITSMRTTDSLTDDESYFFSELKRLKFIVDEIKTDRYFIILDEILKGTNSTDKAIGSRKFVEKLVASNSTGIIATHDLSLCKVAEELPDVKNYFFDARIENDELFFDYTFKPGICQNMNASFLLKKMQIVD
jgi:DNA mismatch repair ATPase MutS